MDGNDDTKNASRKRRKLTIEEAAADLAERTGKAFQEMFLKLRDDRQVRGLPDTADYKRIRPIGESTIYYLNEIDEWLAWYQQQPTSSIPTAEAVQPEQGESSSIETPPANKEDQPSEDGAITKKGHARSSDKKRRATQPRHEHWPAYQEAFQKVAALVKDPLAPETELLLRNLMKQAADKLTFSNPPDASTIDGWKKRIIKEKRAGLHPFKAS